MSNTMIDPITIRLPLFTNLKSKKKQIPKMTKAEYREFVKKAFYDHIKLILPMLDRGVTYTLKKMCGKSFWNSHHPAARRGPGRYISQLVKEGHLPLISLENNSSKSKQYMLK